MDTKLKTEGRVEVIDVSERASEKAWKWAIDGVVLSASVHQEPGGARQEGCAVFSWEMPFKGEGRVEYGLSPALGDVAIGDGPSSSYHKIVLNGLKPRGTRCYVRLICEGDGISWSSPILSFRTLFRYPYGYSFSPSDPALRHKAGDSRIRLPKDSVDIKPLMDKLEGVDPKSYLQHIIDTTTSPDMDEMEKIKAIMAFIGHAVHHNPLYQYSGSAEALRRISQDGWERADIDLDALIILELHYTRCGHVNGLLLPALCRLVGIEAGGWSPPSCHSSGRVKIGDLWYFADVDAFKKGEFPLMEDGSLPKLDWVLGVPNSYLLDTKPAYVDFGSKGDWMLTEDGYLCTGYVGGGHDPSEGAYLSSWYGAKIEYPPSIPQLLPVREFKGDRVLLEWVVR